MTGRHEAAIDMSHAARRFRQKLDTGFNEADWLGIAGDAYQGLGRYTEAAEAYSKALPIFRELFMSRHQARCLLKLGHTHQAIGNYVQAVTFTRESLSIFRELRLVHYERQALREI